MNVTFVLAQFYFSKQHILELMETNAIEYITYKQWVSVDQTTLETITKSVDDFMDSFIDKLSVLKHHSFITSQQSSFQNDIKSKLNDGKFLIICDFSENYSFMLQDEAQGFY